MSNVNIYLCCRYHIDVFSDIILMFQDIMCTFIIHVLYINNVPFSPTRVQKIWKIPSINLLKYFYYYFIFLLTYIFTTPWCKLTDAQAQKSKIRGPEVLRKTRQEVLKSDYLKHKIRELLMKFVDTT
jgi:hypothetical protein